jgi:hypothetical protein
MDQNIVSHIKPAQFSARLAEFGIHSFGCSEDEIRHIESRFGVHLPQAYQDFLSVMGKKCTGFAGCESWEYYALSWVKQSSLGLLELRSDSDDYFCFSRKLAISVPKNAFFFLAEVAEYCLFFDCDEGEDPPIYVVQDGDETYRQCFDSFSACFSIYANQALEHLESEAAKSSDTQHEDGNTFCRMFKAQEVRCSNVASRSLAFELSHYGVVAKNEVVGCSEVEINDLEDDLELSLPLAYRCFLDNLGTASPGYLDDCEWHLPELRSIQQRARLILNANRCEYRLKATDFVFLLRDPDLFLFFDTAEGDVNPPVFRYSVGTDEPSLIHSSFTDWLNSYRSIGHGMEFAVEYEDEEPYFPLIELLTNSPGAVRSIDLSKMVARSKRIDARAERGYSRSRLNVELNKYSFRASCIGDDDEGLLLTFLWTADTRAELRGDSLTLTFPVAGFDIQFSIPRNVIGEWEGQWIREIEMQAQSKERRFPYLLFGQFKYAWNNNLPAPIRSIYNASKSDSKISCIDSSGPAMDVAVDFGDNGIEAQIVIAEQLKISYFFRWNWNWQLSSRDTCPTISSTSNDASILLSDGPIDETLHAELLQKFEFIQPCLSDEIP